MIVTRDGIDLHVTEDGDPAAPPVLLLHGITASSRTWDWLVPDLADRYRVLRLDFRGHGASGRAPDAGAYRFPDHVADAVAVLEQAVAAPCALIGHSLGGITAAALAQRHPDLLRGAVLEDPPLLAAPAPPPDGAPDRPRDTGLEGNALLAGFKAMRRSIPRAQEAGLDVATYVALMAPLPDTTGTSTFGERLCPDAVEAMAASLLAVDAAVLDPVLDGTFAGILDLDVPLGVPAVILTADPASADATARPEAARRLADASPDAEVVVVDRAGHLIHDEKASRETFRTTALALLDRVTP